MKTERLGRFLALSAALVVLAIPLAVWAAPWFVVLSLALAAEGFLLCWVLRAGLLQNLALSFSVALIALLGPDLKTRSWVGPPPIDIVKPADYSRKLFNQPRPTAKSFPVVGTRAVTGEPMYSINYTIDTHGHRLTRGGGPNADTYFFFGDSYTYGVGVDDNETLPSRFSEALGYRYTVANLAFSGLGPHHMLRLLETNEIDPAAVTGKVRRAYYSLIADHQDRVVGRYLYSLTGPKYLLDRGGRPVFQGRFLDNLDGRIGWLAEQAGGAPARLRVLAMQALLPPRYRQDLVVGILAESAKILRERYGAELVVLIWSWPDPASLVDSLRGRGIRGILVADMIGDVDGPSLRQIPGSDDHPTAKADRLLGAALADLENPVHNISAGR